VLFFLGILRLLRTMIVGQPPCDKIVVSSFSGPGVCRFELS
jgi:hypothetical protein